MQKRSNQEWRKKGKNSWRRRRDLRESIADWCSGGCVSRTIREHTSATSSFGGSTINPPRHVHVVDNDGKIITRVNLDTMQPMDVAKIDKKIVDLIDEAAANRARTSGEGDRILGSWRGALLQTMISRFTREFSSLVAIKFGEFRNGHQKKWFTAFQQRSGRVFHRHSSH